MLLHYKLLFISLIAIFSIGSLSAQTTVDLGCQNSNDGVLDLDRKDWNNGNTDFHSEGFFLDFDLPSDSYGDCMKITEVTISLSVNGYDVSALPAGCNIDFYLNTFIAPTLGVTPASVPTAFVAVLPERFEQDLFDLADDYTVFCTNIDMPWDGKVGVDIIARHLSGCPDPQQLISLGLVSMDYDVCVQAVVDVSGSAEILPVSNGPDLCLGEELQLGENGLGNIGWAWSGPNGFSSTGIPNPTYTLSDPSDFDDYTLIVTDGDGCTAEQTITIDQLPDPDVNASAVNLMVCPTQTIELLETEGSPSDSYAWEGPPSFSSSMQNPTIPFSTGLNLGIYTVTITDSTTGCTNEASVEILAANDLAVDVTAVSLEVCPGQDIMLEENGNEGDTWNWTGPSFSSTDEDPVVTNGMPGLYEVTVTDSNTGCSNTGSINIIAGTPPNADADLVDINVCIGQPIELLGSGGTDYEWAGPDSYTSSDQNPMIAVSTMDDFGIYMLTVTDGAGCSATDEVEVFPIVSPSACISGSGEICDSGCDPANPLLIFQISPSTSAVDIELQFSGTGIPNYTLFGVVDGESVIMCGDPDPAISDADFDGTNLILPTDGILNGDNISIQIVNVVDPANPTCTGILDPTCIADFEYQEAISPNIEFNGNIIQNGDLISCEDNFDPNLDDVVSGTWLLDNNIISLPFDLTAYPTGNVTLAFVPDPGECALFVEVDFENVGCSCMITDGILSALTCNENNTPSDDTDDIIIFNLDPQITNGAAGYSLVVSSGSITPTNAIYGGVTNFQLQDGSAGAGDITVTIIDDNDSNCTLDVLIVDPGSCSGSCNITSVNVSNVECNDFSTGSDVTDDFIIYEIEVLGTNISATYTITSSFGTETGNYGVLETFILPSGSAGAGDVTLTISDDGGDPNCTFQQILIDPGSCSDDCNIESAEPFNISCNDNGTPNDDTDDFITFDLDPQGDNLVGDYNLVGVGLPAGSQGTFGGISSFSSNPGTAGNGNLSLDISLVLDPTCPSQVGVADPGTCSGTCNVTSAVASNIQCNDGGTPTDPSDDIITFELLVSGTNTGAGYSITTSFNTLTGTYDVTAGLGIPGAAGGGDLTLTIVDDDDPNCTFEIMIPDPGLCAGTCEITSAVITDVECQNLGTLSDPTDDLITFEILVSGTNTGTGYSIMTSPTEMVTGAYDLLSSFAISGAGSGDMTLTIVDMQNPNCTLDVVLLDPGSCSDGCEIVDANISNISCQDAGTDADDTDDFISFSLDPLSMNGSSNYIITVSSGTVTPNTALYGTQENFVLQDGSAGGGDVVVTIIDEDNVDCSFDVTIPDSGSCSGTCNISSVNIVPIDCDDAGTPSDISDDIITYDIEVLGSNTSTGYTINSIYDTEDGTYGTVGTITLPEGSAGGGDIELTIIDNDDPTCTFEITLTDPGSCSFECDITSLGPSNISCNDNGTPNDDSDDFITFDLDLQGVNVMGDYTLEGAELPLGAQGTFGSVSSFSTNPGTAGSGDAVSFLFTSILDPSCVGGVVLVDPGTCSGTCNITNADVLQVTCDPAGTSTDATDDFITFEIGVNGTNISTGYTLSSSFGDESGSYNFVETFSFPQGSAGAGDIIITIIDNDDPNCTFETTVTDPGSCSGGCDIVDIIVDNIICNDNETDDDDTDDFITFEIDIQGSNLNGDYILSGAGIDASTQESFGGTTVFSTLEGTAGQGDINITLTSLLDSDCNFSFTVADPGVCSIACNDPGNCDDGDCSNGMEFWDEENCECADAEAPNCDNGTIIEMPCDDMDPCTENDMMSVEECTESICMPCQGTPINCESEENFIILECDDNDPNTINDQEVILICDDSVCVPCQGELQVPSIFIPNVFTPNGDSDNDELSIFARGDVMVEEYSIFDRWGELLFIRENVLISDSSLSWNGRFNGELVMPGVYVYYIKLGEPFNEIKVGDFTVIH